MSDSMTKNTKREIAHRLDPSLWAQAVLGVSPQEWQQQFLRTQRGASILVLTARQVGKTTVAAWGMAHTAISLAVTFSHPRPSRLSTRRPLCAPAA